MVDELREKFPQGIVECKQQGNEAWLSVEPGILLAVSRYLKAAGFDYPADLAAVDDGKSLRVVYRLYAMASGQYVVISVPAARKGGALPSVSSIWGGAEWPEREIFDLFGITFQGHPDLRRLLLPADYDGPPPLLKTSG